MEEVRIQILFTQTDPATGLSYTDAIYFKPEEYKATSQKQIDTMKQERFETWKTAVSTASKEVSVEPKEEPPKGVK